MSVATSLAPRVHKTTAVSAKKAFMALHRPGVQKDFGDVLRKGVMRLVVTPKSFVLSRRPDSSRVRVDITADSRELKWLKKLYRKECPKGIIIRFSYEIQERSERFDTPEFYMPVVTFTVMG
jgi:hypothetical protein